MYLSHLLVPEHLYSYADLELEQSIEECWDIPRTGVAAGACYDPHIREQLLQAPSDNTCSHKIGENYVAAGPASLRGYFFCSYSGGHQIMKYI